jgi:F420-0:gamma-glutamyl ligase-like protein
MPKYEVLAVQTGFWRPKTDYLKEIVESIRAKTVDKDIIVVSEKAVSTASNNIVDESAITSNLCAKLIARFWMRIVWGYFLGQLCHFPRGLIQRLREYPLESGSRHKQIALSHAGLLQSLMFGSEGGIDGSNLPYSYVSLTLQNANMVAEKIRHWIQSELHTSACVMIVDTDKTYSFRNFHFTPRPKPVKGIHSFGGFFAYVIGRILKLKKRATPLALVGCRMPIEEALAIAETANRARGFGSGRTVWQMAEKFNVGLTEVSWEMLETVKHKPIVIIRSRR